jgi:NADPH:quinone reductase-like Zn-dependent oxidoreductase
MTVALTGETDADAARIAAAIDGAAPSLILDFVWGNAAEATFRALGRPGLDSDEADIAYVQIGSMGGAEASVPASLLRSRRIFLIGSGAGSASIAEIMAQLPVYMQFIADGRVMVPVRNYPLTRVADAWAASALSRERIVVFAESR